MPEVKGFAHVALSVTDSKRSADFYSKVLDAQVIDASDDISPFHVCVAGTTVIGFRAHAGTPADAFTHQRVGLDHLAFAVADTSELEGWRARLDELGVTNSGIQIDPAGAHLNARDPDNIAIEFFAPAS